jgi:hypothetical protein
LGEQVRGVIAIFNMAEKKKGKETSRITRILIYIFVPISIWFLAFAAWLYWDDIVRTFSRDSGRPQRTERPTRKLDKSDTPAVPSKRSQERILDEDRKKLEDILKQRQ